MFSDEKVKRIRCHVILHPDRYLLSCQHPTSDSMPGKVYRQVETQMYQARMVKPGDRVKNFSLKDQNDKTFDH
jgi:hypothetical protein